MFLVGKPNEPTFPKMMNRDERTFSKFGSAGSQTFRKKFSLDRIKTRVSPLGVLFMYTNYSIWRAAFLPLTPSFASCLMGMASCKTGPFIYRVGLQTVGSLMF